MWIAEINKGDILALVYDDSDQYTCTVTVYSKALEDEGTREFPGVEEAWEWAQKKWKIEEEDWTEIENVSCPEDTLEYLESKYGSAV